MITVGKATSAEYYTSGGGSSSPVASYYLDAVTDGEPPGVWLGHGAATLGLAGEVEADDMHTLFNDFVHPHTREALGRRPARSKGLDDKIAAAQAEAASAGALPEELAAIQHRIERSERTHVIGWDATFALPKSVSMAHTAARRAELAAIRSGDDDRAETFRQIRSGIESAISEANAAGIAVFEDLATSRVGGGSGAPLQWVKTEGLTVASFFQHTNRSIDPHLHQHNVILNRVLCEDGKYRAVDGRDLLKQRFAASAVADRVLMERLASLGYDVQLNADGTARELTVVRPEISQVFSGRSFQVTQAMTPMIAAEEERLGRPLTNAETANIHRFAQRSTRAAKSHGGETVEEHLARAQAQLVAETGYTFDGLGQEVEAHLQNGPRPGQQWSPEAIVREAVAACAARSATWGRANLISEIELRLPVLGVEPGQVPTVLSGLADLALSSEEVVQVTGLDGDNYSAPSATRYAAAETLAAESALRQAAIERGGHTLDAVELKAWLDEHASTLGADQRAAVEALATTDARLAVLVGPAGAGKSFTTGTLAAAWGDGTQGQGRVFGLATSEIATQVLRDDGVAHSRNITQWLQAQERLATTDTAAPDPWRLGAQDVVLVDEASMVSTADLDGIRRHVEAAGARLVLTGDPQQLAAVGAGGVMGLIDGHAETYTLTDIRRFHAEWEREASLKLRAGDPDALVEYDRHGRLVGVDTLDDAVSAAARAAVADRLDGRTTVVVASSNDLAARVSNQVRDQLIELGLVTADGVGLGRDGNTAGVGDVVQCRRNDHTLGVTNRAQYTVLQARPDGGLLVQPLPRPGQDPASASSAPVELPAAYVADDVQLGYAGTVHATQGLTVDNASFVTGGTADAAAQYVAMTRGRHRNTAYVALTTPGHDGDSAPTASTDGGGMVTVDGASVQPTALSVLEAGLDRDDPSDLAATVAAERDREQVASMATITGRLDAEARLACRSRLERHLDDLVHDGHLPEQTRAELATDQGTEYLSRLLRTVEQSGHDPRAVLTEAVTGGKSLDDADSPARVLSHRITRHHPSTRPVPDTELPGDITAAERDRLADLHAWAEERARDLGPRTAHDAPAWSVQSLGPVPDAADAADRADWERRAGQVAGYREGVGWADPEQALGRMPGATTTERRTAYATAWHALGRPEEGLTEAGMTEGQLRVRVRAWQNEQAWAPPNVDRAMQAAELAAETARQDAALADAQARAEDAARLRAEADEAAAKAERLTDAAQVRADWVTQVAVSQSNGEAADAELKARGVRIGAEPDRTDAATWLAAEAEARTADDAHRPITEADLHEPAAGTEAALGAPDPHSPELVGPEPAPRPEIAAEAAATPGDGTPSRQATNDTHTVLDASIDARQLEALAATTAATAAITADRISEEAAHEDAVQEDLAIASLDAGRQRREAAELDRSDASEQAADIDMAASSGSHDSTVGSDHRADFGTEQ